MLVVLAAAAGASVGGVPGRDAGGDGEGTPTSGRGGVAGDGEGGRPAGGPARAGVARVTRVVDGDTAVLAPIGRVRLIGVDTPEIHGRPECFGAQASAFAERALAGQRVRYERGARARDRYGRALVYLWLSDGRLFNELLIDGGFAVPLAIAPNVRFAERFARRAHEARAAGRGLWSREACR